MNEYLISESMFRGHTPFRYDPEGAGPEWLQGAIRDADGWAKRVLPIMWLSLLAMTANNDPVEGFLDEGCLEAWVIDYPQHAHDLVACLKRFVEDGALRMLDGGFQIVDWKELYSPSPFIIEIAKMHKFSQRGSR